MCVISFRPPSTVRSTEGTVHRVHIHSQFYGRKDHICKSFEIFSRHDFYCRAPSDCSTTRPVCRWISKHCFFWCRTVHIWFKMVKNEFKNGKQLLPHKGIDNFDKNTKLELMLQNEEKCISWKNLLHNSKLLVSSAFSIYILLHCPISDFHYNC